MCYTITAINDLKYYNINEELQQKLVSLISLITSIFHFSSTESTRKT